MTAIILVCASCLILTVYLVAYIICRGIPASISDTYYHNERKWLFPTTLSISASLALIPFMDITPEPWKFLSFISIAAIFFIAASPAFKESLVNSVHCISAIVLGTCVFAWLFLAADFPFIAFIGIAIGIFNRNKFVFWLEVGLLYDLYYNLFVLLCYCNQASA